MGRTVFIQLVVGAFLTLGVSAAETADPDTGAPAQVWDFGYVPQKSEVSHEFYLHNTGKNPLTVDKIKAGCSCTSVSEISRPIDPGDSAAISVTFKSGRYSGLVKKTTHVYTDDPETPVLNLRIVANVIKEGDPAGELNLAPQKFIWKLKNATIGADADTLVITAAGTDPGEISVVHAPAGVVDQVEFPNGTTFTHEAKVLLHPSKAPIPSRIAGSSITLAFFGADTTIVTVPIELKD